MNFMKVLLWRQSTVQRMHRPADVYRSSRASIKNCSEWSSKDQQLEKHFYYYWPCGWTRRLFLPLIQNVDLLGSLSSEALEPGYGYWVWVSILLVAEFFSAVSANRNLMTLAMTSIFLAQFLKHNVALAFGHYKVLFKVHSFPIASNSLWFSVCQKKSHLNI